MKKLILIIAIMANAFSAFAQSILYVNKKDGSVVSFNINDIDSISFTAANTVLINGVRWATCNVAASGFFASSPEAYGSFYQWNSNTAWDASSDYTIWNNLWNGGFTTPANYDVWAKANDPSPAGFRLPTNAELETLLDVTKVDRTWITQNGVHGHKFTDIATGKFVFFPASGIRLNNGMLYLIGEHAEYWTASSGSGGGDYAYSLYSASSFANCTNGKRAEGKSIRPVAE